MSTRSRMLQTNADKSSTRNEGMADLVIFYTDRLSGRIPFEEEPFSLAIATTDNDQRKKLAKTVFTGRPKEFLGYP